MDPLSDVVSLLKPRSYLSAGFDAGGKWSVQFARHDGFIKCYAVVRGWCWLAVDGVPDPVRLDAGDCFLLASGRPFRLAADLTATPVDAEAIFSAARYGGVAVCNGGGEFFLVGSRFAVSGHHAGMLLGVLPPILPAPHRAAVVAHHHHHSRARSVKRKAARTETAPEVSIPIGTPVSASARPRATRHRRLSAIAQVRREFGTPPPSHAAAVAAPAAPRASPPQVRQTQAEFGFER